MAVVPEAGAITPAGRHEVVVDLLAPRPAAAPPFGCSMCFASKKLLREAAPAVACPTSTDADAV